MTDSFLFLRKNSIIPAVLPVPIVEDAAGNFLFSLALEHTGTDKWGIFDEILLKALLKYV